jgi:hypothetical protein
MECSWLPAFLAHCDLPTDWKHSVLRRTFEIFVKKGSETCVTVTFLEDQMQLLSKGEPID